MKGTIASLRLLSIYVCVYDCMFFYLILPFEVSVLFHCEFFFHVYTLDDQTQVDSKPAGQPEHASLNQCQLIATY